MEIEEIDKDFLNKLLEQDSSIIIDIREKEEFQDFNIGGFNMPAHTLGDHIEYLSNFKILIIVCSNGMRSHIMARVIQKKIPSAKVYHLTEGII